jgi:hypothetical protein
MVGSFAGLSLGLAVGLGKELLWERRKTGDRQGLGGGFGLHGITSSNGRAIPAWERAENNLSIRTI